MTDVATRMRPGGEWTLLNALYSRYLWAGAPTLAVDMVLRAGWTGRDALKQLMGDRLVCAAQTPDDTVLTHDELPANLAGVKLRLTPAGLRWITSNPYNRALWAAARPGSSMGANHPYLADAAAEFDLHTMFDAVCACIDKGLTFIGDAADQRSRELRGLTPTKLAELANDPNGRRRWIYGLTVGGAQICSGRRGY